MKKDKRKKEILNGYSVDLLARALYDARSMRRDPATNEEWARHAARFPQTHRILMEDARREAMNN